MVQTLFETQQFALEIRGLVSRLDGGAFDKRRAVAAATTQVYPEIRLQGTEFDYESRSANIPVEHLKIYETSIEMSTVVLACTKSVTETCLCAHASILSNFIYVSNTHA